MQPPPAKHPTLDALQKRIEALEARQDATDKKIHELWRGWRSGALQALGKIETALKIKGKK